MNYLRKERKKEDFFRVYFIIHSWENYLRNLLINRLDLLSKSIKRTSGFFTSLKFR